MIQTELTRRLGCTAPIVQTAMGWVADAGLVIASTRAGAFGFLAGATIEPDDLEPQILQVKAAVGAQFGLNFHMFQENAEDCIRLAIAHGLRAVSYGRGPDAKTIARLKDAGVLCIPTVGAVEHAVKAEKLGADLITIQGAEGGGHTGRVPSSILLPQVLDAVKVPVIAAGGYSTGRGLAGALAAGACGVAMGTRFMMSAESPTPKRTMARYLEVKDPGQIRVTEAVDGLRHRMIETELVRRLESSSGLRRLLVALGNAWRWKAQTGMSVHHLARVLVRSFREDPTALATTIMAANQPMLIMKSMIEDRPEEGLLPSGQVAAAIRSQDSCQDIVNALVAEAEACLRASSHYLSESSGHAA